jgi:hypothetical protein
LAADIAVMDVSSRMDCAAARENAPDTTVASPIDPKNPRT